MLPRTLLRSLVAVALLAGPAVAGAEVLASPAPASATPSRPTQLVSRIGSTPVSEPAYRAGNRSTPQGLSGDGRYLLFTTDSGPSTDDNGVGDVFLRDRRTGATELVSVRSDGRTSEAGARIASISGDGRYVAFVSQSRDFDGEDRSFDGDVFVRDRRAGTTRMVSRFPDGSGTGSVTSAHISADGRTVVWTTDGFSLYVRRLPDGPIRIIASGAGFEAAVSGDGSHVAYGRFDGREPVRRYRVADGATDVVSTAIDGSERGAFDPQISHTGQVVSFLSRAPDVRPGPPSAGATHLYVRDLSPGGSYIRLVGGEVRNHSMSGDGLTYVFTNAWDLVPEDTDGVDDVYSATPFGDLQLLSEDLEPATGMGRLWWPPEVSADGKVATVVSSSTTWSGSTVAAPRVFALAVEKLPEATARVADWFPRLFGRPLTPAERDVRVAQLADLERTSAEVVIDDLRRESFSGPRAGVVRLYQAYFLRPPDTAGYDYWVGRRRAGTTLDRISQDFAASAEFRRLYGSLTNRQFVERVYLNVLGRAGDAAGIAFWTAELDRGGRTRGQVMTGFSESAENRERTSLTTETIMLFHARHGRVPGAPYLAGTVERGRDGLGITAELRFIAAA